MYIRVELNGDYFLKDLRELIDLNKKENLTDISNVDIDMTRLIEYLNENKDKINKIYYWIDCDLKIDGCNNNDLKDCIKDIKVKKLEL